ncbi:MAG: DNA-directed RNA polymerase subunit alpha [Patescibacteria group bacterium]
MNYTLLLPSKPFIEREEGNRADIVIEGLHPGYGITIGNALRRVLFSSLPGAAVTRVKIEGVNHEFSTIPGVLEDVLLILLNIKQLRFKVFTDGPETVSFEAKGVCEIKAGDIKTSSNLEIVNVDQHIATLTKKTSALSFELTVERGVGYQAKEILESKRVESGVLVLDAIFTPIRKVSYNVENMRVGSSTDYNRLVLSIDTDGTIPPREAFSKGLDLLIGQLDELRSFREKGEIAEVPDAKIAHVEEISTESEYSETLLEDIKFSSHTLNALARNGLKKVGDLVKHSESELREFDGVGEKAMQEIHRELGNFGITLKNE